MNCPVCRPSLDPVDRQKDEAFHRQHYALVPAVASGNLLEEFDVLPSLAGLSGAERRRGTDRPLDTGA